MTQGTLTRGRLAEHPAWRNALEAADLAARMVLPLIVSDAVEDREAVEGSGGLARISITEAVREARSAAAAGIAGLLVYGATERRDETALLASQRDHVVPRAIHAIKDAVPGLAVATDVCVCGYTSHGQCVLFSQGGADIEGTLARLAEIARVHAEAGADLLVPSGMLDGTVAALRGALAGEHEAVPVAAMAKVESTLHGLQRIATGTARIAERAVPLLDPLDGSAAQARIRRDIASGADAVVVAPAMTALDLIAALAAGTDRPIVAYHTADEHAILAAESDAEGMVAERELLAASRRAGAQLLIAHGALAV